MDVQRGIHIDGSLCEAAATSGNLKFKNNIVGGTSAGRITEVNSGSSFNAPAWFGANSNDSLLYSNPAFTSLLNTPYSYLNPDYRPSVGSLALSGASFTDAALSAATGTSATVAQISIPSSTCVGQSTAVINPAQFVASTTLSSNYCSLSWSVSPGVTISSTSAINPSFTISTLGTFSVYLMVMDGNGLTTSMSAITTNTCLDVAVGEVKNEIGSISLFPNPSKDLVTLTVNSQNTNALTVNVYDITGKTVLTPVKNQNLITGENKYSLNTSDLNNGIYFVTLTTANGKETVKLIVNK